MTPSVCVLGSLNMDLVVRSPRLPFPGETILGGAFATLPGGKGANQAVAAARAGARVRMVGRLGADAHGEQLRRVLSGEGVDHSGVHATSEAPTGVALITIDDSTGQNTIVVAGGANATVGRSDVDLSNAAIAASAVLLMQLETPTPAVGHAAAVARRLGATVMLNAAPAPPQGVPRDILALVDVLIVNRTEAALLAGLNVVESESLPASDLLRAAANLGPRAVVLTLGGEGVGALVNGSSMRCGAFTVRAVDTVGCGDAFCGTLAAALASVAAADRVTADSIATALVRASAAAALAATRHGAIPSLPKATEVDELIARQPTVRVQRG